MSALTAGWLRRLHDARRAGAGLASTRPAGAHPEVVVPDQLLRDAARSRALLDLARTHSP